MAWLTASLRNECLSFSLVAVGVEPTGIYILKFSSASRHILAGAALVRHCCLLRSRSTVRANARRNKRRASGFKV
jgi:hypothetical protein